MTQSWRNRPRPGTGATVAAFVLALVAVFAAALGVGSVVGPVGAGAAAAAGSTEEGTGMAGHDGTTGDPDRSARPGSAAEAAAAGDGAAGLTSSDRGYTLAPAQDVAPAGAATPVRFTVTDPDGLPVTDYVRSHDQDLHLIAVRRDLTGYQHVHPALAPDGTWTTALDLSAGTWRLFADFVPAAGGEKLVLGADLHVAGTYAPTPVPAPATTAEVDGYTVTLAGGLTAGSESELTLTVLRNGRPVTDLQPYLGAYGHLVVLRDGDLGYLHVHPAGEPGDGRTEPGPDVSFFATAPSAGTYRLFLDFRHGDVVRTAGFTVETGAAGPGIAGVPHD